MENSLEEMKLYIMKGEYDQYKLLLDLQSIINKIKEEKVKA